jgi:hypothetical protein
MVHGGPLSGLCWLCRCLRIHSDVFLTPAACDRARASTRHRWFPEARTHGCARNARTPTASMREHCTLGCLANVCSCQLPGCRMTHTACCVRSAPQQHKATLVPRSAREAAALTGQLARGLRADTLPRPQTRWRTRPPRRQTTNAGTIGALNHAATALPRCCGCSGAPWRGLCTPATGPSDKITCRLQGSPLPLVHAQQPSAYTTTAPRQPRNTTQPSPSSAAALH